ENGAAHDQRQAGLHMAQLLVELGPEDPDLQLDQVGGPADRVAQGVKQAGFIPHGTSPVELLSPESVEGAKPLLATRESAKPSTAAPAKVSSGCSRAQVIAVVSSSSAFLSRKLSANSLV